MVISALTRKLLRDLWRTRPQVASIAAVLAGGVMTVVAMRGTSSALATAQQEYYETGRFADVFATLTRAHDGVIPRLAAIPGVATVTTRVVKDVRLDVPGLDLPAVGRLIALPEARDSDVKVLNVVRVLRGRTLSAGAPNEVLINSRFAEANRLSPGDTIAAVINERRVDLLVAGIAGAPDYLYEEATSGMFTDERAFGLLWAPHDLVAAATGMRGAFNDVAIALAPGARREQVITEVDSVLAPYGGRGAIGRKDQISNRVVENELHQLAVMGMAFPAFFVAVAAFLAGSVLTRLIATERDQIAVLKAFGYTNRAVGLHYLSYAAAAIVIGIAAGLLVGAFVGRSYTALYQDILRIPGLRFRADWGAISIALVVLCTATLAGASRAVRAAAMLAPAEAMRPPVPARYGPLLLDRIGFGNMLSVAARMVLRALERRPSRALLGASGVAAALAMMAGALSLYDASDRMISVQFRIGHRETLGVQFVTPSAGSARDALLRLPGVTDVELQRMVPVRIRHAGRSRMLAITGLEQGSVLQRLVDTRGVTMAMPPDGVVLSASLATRLDTRPGDTVLVELLEQLETRPVVVAATMEEIMSPNAYMSLDALGRLIGDGTRATTAQLRLASAPTPELFAGLHAMPRVGGVSSRQAMLDRFDRMMAQGFRITSVLVVAFASIIAIGVVYNGARIALSERSRELASLRVLGFTTREVGAMLLGEQALLTAAAVPIGWGLGWLFAAYLVKAFESEEYTIPLVSQVDTYAFASVVVVLASAAAASLMYRRVSRLDLVAVLKTRE